MRSILGLTALLLACFTPAAVEALTIRDLIELSRAGLGDEVLLALIEVDRPMFPIDSGTLRSLKTAGVSERVILAVIRSGRVVETEPAQAVALPAPHTQVVVDRREPAPALTVVAVPVPVYVPVQPRTLRVAPKPPEPVYWGWGGKLRPDAWQPTPAAQPPQGETVRPVPVIRIEPIVIKRQ